MIHFGIICPPIFSHLNGLFSIGRELQRRGHRVTLLGTLDTQPMAVSAGLEFKALAESKRFSEVMMQSNVQSAELNRIAALQSTIRMLQELTTLFLQNAPTAISEAGIDALIINQVIFGGGTVAEYLGIPFVTACCALILNPDDSVPPCFTAWNYNPAWWARLRNRAFYYLIEQINQPIRRVISEYRKQWKLTPLSSINELDSKLAIIYQLPMELEFPRQNLPPWFHFTGSFRDLTTEPAVDFPFEKLTEKPLIYASMGTLVNQVEKIFRCIAQACESLDAQLVISLGGNLEPEVLPKLPGEPLIVKYAPQLELLKKARLTITHAGANTVIESLSNGVPMVGIPLGKDQPGIAARIAWTGSGEFLLPSGLNVSRLRSTIQRVLTQNSYKQNAVRLQAAICRAGGVRRAADIIEQAIANCG
ncbi:glycosyltransferase [Scytonema sp. PCC 10023]|uniref:glycosyltransferase n=1 Tax=Scytonema sp. PCC 10023 TaxID=1680591 RepID=UPI0039C7393E